MAYPEEVDTQDTEEQDEALKSPVPYRELIVEALDNWREKLTEQVYQVKEARERKKRNPQLMVNTQSGQMSISNILEQRSALLEERLGMVLALEEMLEKIQEEPEAVLKEAQKLLESSTVIIEEVKGE